MKASILGITIKPKLNIFIVCCVTAVVGLFEGGKPTIGKHNIIKYDNKEVLVEIDVLSARPNSTHYRGVLIEPNRVFSK